MELSLEALGITTEELQDRVIDKIVGRILTNREWDYETEEEYESNSDFARKLKKRVQEMIDQKINDMADKHILPNVSQYIENLTLQETNKWGEKKGESVTFIEYLANRAEEYMREEVDLDGKGKGEQASYSWSGSKQSRITYLIHRHLQYSISEAMKNALKIANASIADGIQETVKMKLAEVVNGIKLSVSVKG
jgi:hypothetical protein